MITREVQLRVRYKETDAMGVVHHSNYVTYYETARTEMLRTFGTTYREMEAEGVMMPVIEVDMRYISPAYYDDLLTIRITLKKLPAVKIEFFHEVFNESGQLINTGRVLLAFMSSATRRPCRAPESFLKILRENGL